MLYNEPITLTKGKNMKQFTSIFCLFLFLIVSINGAFCQDKNTVKIVQELLTDLGYNPGPIDGIFGKKTGIALMQFQKRNNLPSTGKIDSKSLDILFSRIENIIPHSYSLVRDFPDGDFSGEINISSKENQCRQIIYSVDVIYDGKGGFGEEGSFQIFYPGIKFKFMGDICIPDKGESYNFRFHVRNEVAEGGSMGLVDGKLVTTGPIKISGTIDMFSANDASVYKIQSISSEPLVLLLTKIGFKYISGKGTVTIPNGQKFDFNDK